MSLCCVKPLRFGAPEEVGWCTPSVLPTWLLKSEGQVEGRSRVRMWEDDMKPTERRHTEWIWWCIHRRNWIWWVRSRILPQGRGCGLVQGQGGPKAYWWIENERRESRQNTHVLAHACTCVHTHTRARTSQLAVSSTSFTLATVTVKTSTPIPIPTNWGSKNTSLTSNP